MHLYTDVKEYLDELKSPNLDDINDATTATLAAESVGQSMTESIVEIDESTTRRTEETVKPNVGDGRDFERWLFSDWLNKPTGKGGRQKEPALPILKEAKWNSGDNPVLVTAAM